MDEQVREEINYTFPLVEHLAKKQKGAGKPQSKFESTAYPVHNKFRQKCKQENVSLDDLELAIAQARQDRIGEETSRSITLEAEEIRDTATILRREQQQTTIVSHMLPGYEDAKVAELVMTIQDTNLASPWRPKVGGLRRSNLNNEVP